MDTFSIYVKHLKPERCNCCLKDNVVSRIEKSNLFTCTQCKIAKYCNVDCQRQDWKAQHKRECKRFKQGREFWIKDSLRVEESGDGTSLFIMATRLATEIGDPKLAVELYEKAAGMEAPCEGGHPTAMVHLAYHYEHGIGTKQDFAKAFQWYSRILSHPFPGGENVSPTFLGLSRLYRDGLGVAKSKEMADKYAAFSESNAGTPEEIAHLEHWWAKQSQQMKE